MEHQDIVPLLPNADWRAEPVRQGYQDSWYIYAPWGCVTVDFVSRDFALGQSFVSPMNRSARSGRAWRVNLVNDAVACLKRQQ